MASLALIVSLVLLFTVSIGLITYILSRLHFPSFIIYLLSILSILNGLWFISIGLPIWYLGLIPVYFGYISIQRVSKRHSGKIQVTDVDNR
jgi:hypothetical protein